MSARPLVRLPLLLLAVLAAGSCSRSVDIKQAVQIVETSSGWFDAGIKDGKNKIVPSVTFRLKKASDADIAGVALNVMFRHPPADGANTEEDWDEVFIQRAAFASGDQTELLTVRPEKGYTGDPPQSRLEMLRNSQFRDVRARIYARYSSSKWVEIGTVDVQRQLLVH